MVRETIETRGEEGNLVLGGFPKVHGDAIICHHPATQEELERPLSGELTTWVEERTDLHKMVEQEAGGEMVCVWDLKAAVNNLDQ